MMKRIMHILFLSCLKATEMIEKKLHFRLSWRENLQLEMHKMMCNACTMYEKHSHIIDESLAKQEHLRLHHINLDQFKKSLIEKLPK